jgi:hypothetical protein
LAETRHLSHPIIRTRPHDTSILRGLPADLPFLLSSFFSSSLLLESLFFFSL